MFALDQFDQIPVTMLRLGLPGQLKLLGGYFYFVRFFRSIKLVDEGGQSFYALRIHTVIPLRC